MKILFDVQELYYLAQYLPVFRVLEKKGVECFFVIYENPSFNHLLVKAVQEEGLPCCWVKDNHGALGCYLTEKADWVIFGNHFFDLASLHTVSKSAQFGHAIGIKKSYYTKSKAPMTVRFIEGQRRFDIIKRMYPRGNYHLTGFAKLDPLYNGEAPSLDLCQLGLDPEKKTILYAPTFYPSSIELFPDEFPGDFAGYNIIVKPHYFSQTKTRYYHQREKFTFWNEYPNVHLASVDDHSLLPFMATADLLISEASSSIFEFAALDKPVVWCDFLYLRWSYRGPLSFRLTRRLDQDILQFSDIGAHAKDYSALKRIVDEQTAHPEMFSQKRRACSELFVGPDDGQASERIVDYLVSNKAGSS